MSGSRPSRAVGPCQGRLIAFVENNLQQGSTASYSAIADDTYARYFPEKKREELFRNEDFIQRLVEELFADERRLSHSQILSIPTLKKSYQKTFALLVYIGGGHYIKQFMSSQGLSDTRLPHDTCPANFPPTLDGWLWNDFQKYQFRFCVPKMTIRWDYELVSQTILPFKVIEALGKGASSKTLKIEVDPDYNELHEQVTDTQARNLFAVKVFDFNRPARETQFKNEVQAYLYLQPNRLRDAGILHFFGSFEHGQNGIIILEYADGGTLEDFFKKHHPCVHVDIFKVWESLTALLSTLRSLGSLMANDGRYQGWHNDITTKNIVLIKRSDQPYDYAFKLADLGLAHFRKQHNNRAEDVDWRGTRMNGPPECYRPDDRSQQSPIWITALADIWSVGCVFSEVATWIVMGTPGLERYRKTRRECQPEVLDKGCFHDIVDVHRSVIEHHTYLKTLADKLTAAVIEDLIPLMLTTANKRLDANSLYRMAFKLLSEYAWMGNNSCGSPSTVHVTSGKAHGKSILQKAGETHASSQPEASAVNLRGLDGTNLFQLNKETVDRKVETENPNSPPQSQGARESECNSCAAEGATQQPQCHLAQSMSTKPFIPPSRSGISIKGSARSLEMTSSSTQCGRHEDAGLVNTHRIMERDSSVNNRSSVPNIKYLPGWIFSFFKKRSVSSIFREKQSPTPEEVDSDDMNSRPLKTFKSIQNPGWIPEPHLSAPNSNDQCYWTLEYVEERHKLGKGLQEGWHGELRDYNFIWLVDNSSSMEEHYPNVIRLSQHMPYYLKKFDPNGLELRFTCSTSDKQRRYYHCKHLAAEVKRHDPGRGLKNERPYSANISTSLGRIIDDYRIRIETQGRRNLPMPKKLIIYVLTNGLWQKDDDTTEKDIAQLIQSMDQYRVSNPHVGIQFIQFGNEPEGWERLDHLDESLDLSRDIVDNEPFMYSQQNGGGNVFKMIFGSINKSADHMYEQNNKSHSREHHHLATALSMRSDLIGYA